MKFLNGVDVEDGHIQLSDTYKIQWGGSNARIDGSNASDYIRLWTSDTERMRIDSSGNVGIGTTSPNALLEISRGDSGQTTAVAGGDNLILSDSSNGGMSIFTPSTALGSIFFGDESDSDVGWIRYNHTNDYMLIGTGGGTRVTIKNNGLINLAAYGAGYLKSDASGNITVDTSTIEDTLDSVTDRGATTTNAITVGEITGEKSVNGDVNFRFKNNSTGASSAGNVWIYGEAFSTIRFTKTSTSSQRGTIVYDFANEAMGFRTNGVSNRLYINSSGNVGIGTTSPNEKLTVAGNIHAYAPSGINAGLFASTAAGATSIAIRSSGVTYFNSGNVGIGTTNPSEKLHVFAEDNGDGILIESSAVGTNRAPALKLFPKSSSANNRYWAISPYKDTPEGLSFSSSNAKGDDPYSSGTTRMLIDGITGNVGIGTTSPDGVLHIKKDNAPATFEIQGGLNTQTTAGAINGEINFGVNDPSTTGGIGASIKNISQISNGAHNGLAFFTGLQSRTPYLQQMLYFTAQGGLSFGTTNTDYGTSGQILKSNADAPPSWVNASTVIGGPYLPLAGGTMSGGLNIEVSTSNTQLKLKRTTSATGEFNIYTNTDSLFFHNVGQSTYPMMINSSGNVGIGTTSPQAALHVAGAFNSNAPTGNGVLMGFYSSSHGYIQLNGPSGGYIDFSTSGTDHKGRLLYDNTSNYMRFDTNGSEKMRIASSGNVGIGTTSPGVKFQVDAGSNIASFRSVGSGQNNKEFLIQTGGDRVVLDSKNADDGTAAALAFELGSSEKMRIIASGNVGIGTTSPSQKLHVAGKGLFTDFVRFNGVTAPDFPVDIDAVDGGKSLRSTRGTSVFRIDQGNDGPGYIGMQSADDFSIQTNNTSKIYITSAGNVGIGTTSPTGVLDVLSRDDQRFVRFRAPNGEERYQFHVGGTGNSAYMTMYQADGTTGAVRINSNGTSYFNGGNVGIGTTSPNAKLNVKSSDSTADQITLTHSGNTVNIVAIGQESSHGSLFLRANSGVNKVRLSAAGNNSYILDSNVGIGTTSPNTALQVNQNTTVPLLIHRPSNTSFDPHGIGFSTRNDTANGGLGDVRSGIFSDYNGDLFLAAATSSITTSPLVSSRLFIEGSNGNVGIGTTSPGEKLEVAGNIKIGDSNVMYLGAGNDLQIYHDGSNSYITDTGTGNLLITSNGASVQINKGLTENMAEFIVDGAVNLYYDSAKKFETTSTGVEVTGKITNLTAGTGNLDAVNVQQLNDATTGALIFQGTWSAASTTTGVHAAGSTSTIIVLEDPNLGVSIGSTVTGTGIPAGTTVTTYYNSGAFGLSAAITMVNGAVATFTTVGGIPDLSRADQKVTGNYYICETAGVATPNGASTTPDEWAVGDWVAFSDLATDAWQKIDNSSVLSGAGTGGTVPAWSGSGTSVTLADAPITVSGGDTTITGNLGVGAVNASYNLYNNGTSYFNGSVIVDATFTQTGGAASTFSGDVAVGGKTYPKISLTDNQGVARTFSVGTNNETFTVRNETASSDAFTISNANNATFAGNVTATNILTVAGAATGSPYLQFTQGGSQKAYIQYADSGDSFELQSDNQFAVRTGGSTAALIINSSQNATFAGDVTLSSGALSITGDGSNAATLTESSAGIFTIAAVDDIRLDATGDISLDAGGDDIRLKVSGTEYAKFNNSSSNLNIFSSIQDKAIKFIGNDNGTEITALTLNMADGGDATFAGDVTTVGNLTAGGNITTNSGIFYSGNATKLDLNQYNSGYLRLLTNNTERVRVTATGNVGIGTTSPTLALDVRGTQGSPSSSGTSQTGSLSIRGAGSHFMSSGMLNVSPWTGWFQAQDANNLATTYPLALNPNGGNVGIGLNSPSEKLHVYHATTNILGYLQSGDADATLAMADNGGSVRIQNTSGNLRFLTGGTASTSGSNTSEVMRITSSGRVGIGTTNPTRKLHVVGGSKYAALLDSDQDYTLGLARSGTEEWWLKTYTDGRFAIHENGVGDKVTIKAGGNVGIGTTSPTSKLTVAGQIMIAPSSGTPSIKFQDSGTTNAYIDLTDTQQRFDFRDDSDTVMSVTLDTLRVGVGTTNPQSKLQVAGGIQMAGDTAAASANKAGTMRYRTGTEYVEVNGTELVTNGDFATDTGWTKGTGWTISGGTANAATATSDFTQTVSFTLGQTYRLTYTVSNYSAGAVRTNLGAYAANTPISANGNYTDIFTPTNVSSNSLLYFEGQSGFAGSIDNVSMVEVTSEDASYADMCMQTGSSTYEWVNIVRNTY
jgi:hypothetical protein